MIGPERCTLVVPDSLIIAYTPENNTLWIMIILDELN